MELSRGGSGPVELPNGERRLFPEDGDEVLLKGIARNGGHVPIGFGECRGVILPAGQ